MRGRDRDTVMRALLMKPGHHGTVPEMEGIRVDGNAEGNSGHYGHLQSHSFAVYYMA
jgi:hypothetical protein